MTVEFHLIQNYPPANPNRDQNGAPKDCEFGGHRRARISSQSLKRAARKNPTFEQHIQGQIADRSKRVAEELAKRLHEQNPDIPRETFLEGSSAFLRNLLGRKKQGNVNASVVDSKGEMPYAYYISPDEMKRLINIIFSKLDELQASVAAIETAKDKVAELKTEHKKADEPSEDEQKEAKKKETAAEKKVKKAESELSKLFVDEAKKFAEEQETFARTSDIALFGRMLADAADLNIDAASQVAHAIATNRLKADFDFYTAVDDFQPDTESGAGMMGTIGFNSSCFYRYALVDMNQLALNLTPPPDSKGKEKQPTRAAKEASLDGLEAFLRACIFSVPTGKIHSHAQNVQPQFIMVVVRDGKGAPCSLVNAFVKPARPRTGDWEVSLVEDSIAKLARHWKSHIKMFGKHHSGAYFVAGEDLDIPIALGLNGVKKEDFPARYDLSEKDSVDELVQTVRSDMGGWLNNTPEA